MGTEPTTTETARARAWRHGKRLLRVVILVLVAWGIWRTGIKAERDFALQQQAWRQDLQALDQQLQQARATGDEASQRQLEAQRRILVSQEIDWKRIEPAWLVVACAMYLTGTAAAWWFWHQSLIAMGQHPRPLESLRAYMIGHLGKYVPGKALVVVLRATLVQSPRVETWAAVAAVFVETLTLMAVGAAVAALLLPVALGGWQQPMWLLGAVALAVVAGVPTVPSLFRTVVRYLMRKRSARNLEGALRGLDARHMTRGWLIMGVGWLFLGLSLWATVRGLPGDSRSVVDSLHDLPLLTACTALAMVLGFVSLIPGGFGVRELVMTSLLAPRPHYGAARALVAAIVLRVVWLMAELVVSGGLYLIRGPVSGRELDAETIDVEGHKDSGASQTRNP